MPEQFLDPTIVMFGKLVLASVLGMLLGTERMVAGKGAGTRTFALVTLGACLMVVVSNHVTSSYLGFVNFDPLRTAAAIIMGIGFLGGGIIVFRAQDQMPHGITTAAGIWVAAAVGISVGFGMYAVAAFTTALILLIFTVVWFGEYKLKKMFAVRSQSITRSQSDEEEYIAFDAPEREKYSASEDR